MNLQALVNGYNDSTTVTIETDRDTNMRIKEETIFECNNRIIIVQLL